MTLIDHHIAHDAKDFFTKVAQPSLGTKQSLTISNAVRAHSIRRCRLHKVSRFIIPNLLSMLVNCLLTSLSLVGCCETVLTKLIIAVETGLILMIFIPKH